MMDSETLRGQSAGEAADRISRQLREGGRGKTVFSVSFREDRIPMIALRSGQDGPTVWIQAALHGDECDGSAAVLRLADTLAPRLVHGNVLLVPVVSVTAFREGRLSSPKDGKNLNRMAKDSEIPVTYSKAYFDWLREVIASTAEVLIDLHGGGYYLDVLPFAILPAGEGADFDAESRMVAGCKLSGLLQSRNRGSLVEAAAQRGICSVLLECGGGTALTEQAIGTHRKNAEIILENLGLLSGQSCGSERLGGQIAEPSENSSREETLAGRPQILTDAIDVYFERDGILKSVTPVGTVVRRGDEIYRTADWETLEETVYRCPVEEALVLSVHNTALVKKGAYAVYLGLFQGK